MHEKSKSKKRCTSICTTNGYSFPLFIPPKKNSCIYLHSFGGFLCIKTYFSYNFFRHLLYFWIFEFSKLVRLMIIYTIDQYRIKSIRRVRCCQSLQLITKKSWILLSSNVYFKTFKQLININFNFTIVSK